MDFSPAILEANDELSPATLEVNDGVMPTDAGGKRRNLEGKPSNMGL